MKRWTMIVIGGLVATTLSMPALAQAPAAENAQWTPASRSPLDAHDAHRLRLVQQALGRLGVEAGIG